MGSTKEAKRLTPEQQQLVLDNIKLTSWAVGYDRWRVLVASYPTKQDAQADACLALCRAARDYDPTKSKFSTYANRVIKHQFLTQFQKSKALKNQMIDGALCQSHMVGTKVYEADTDDGSEMDAAVYYAKKFLRGTPRKILLYALAGKTVSQIAKSIGWKPRSVSTARYMAARCLRNRLAGVQI